MKRLVVEARTDALDDWEFDEDDNPVRPGGHDVAQWLARELGKGGTVLGPFIHSFYGWDFSIANKLGKTWCLVAGGAAEGTMYLWAEKQPGLKGLLGIGKGPRMELLEQAAALLEQDARFDGIRIVEPGAE